MCIYTVTHRNELVRFASGGGGKTIKIWGVREGADATLRHTLNGHSMAVWSIALSPDDRFIASASREDVVLWSVATGLKSVEIRQMSEASTRACTEPEPNGPSTTPICNAFTSYAHGSIQQQSDTCAYLCMFMTSYVCKHASMNTVVCCRIYIYIHIHIHIRKHAYISLNGYADLV